ncbi:MAG: hypothetical protein ACFFDP_07375 [Promethearchaeota archaeon]
MMYFLTELLMLVSILLIGLALRYLPHIHYYFPGTSDMFYHFSKIRDPSYGEEEMMYPPLFHWFFRIFRRRDGSLPERSLTFLTPLSDIGTALIFYLFLHGTFGIEFALMAVLIFLVTPTVVIQGITFSPRPIGLLFVVSSLLCLTFPFPFNFLAMIPIALTLLTHRLATQTLFFISLGLTFFNWQVGFVFLGGVGLALLLSRGQFSKSLQSHLAFIKRYITGTKYPNRRLLGIFLAPTLLGLIGYLAIHLLSTIFPFPIVFIGEIISELPIVYPHIETIFLIWSSICLLLLIFWLAGESYRYTYYACVPFAFFCVFLIQSSSLFLIAVVILIGLCVAVSIFFSTRIQHLDRDVVTLLRYLSRNNNRVYFLVPYHLLRAAKYFSQKEGTYVIFTETTIEKVATQIESEKITHVVVNHSHLNWFPKLIQIKQCGDWYLLQSP